MAENRIFGKSLIVFYIVEWGGVLLPLKLKKKKLKE